MRTYESETRYSRGANQKSCLARSRLYVDTRGRGMEWCSLASGCAQAIVKHTAAAAAYAMQWKYRDFVFFRIIVLHSFANRSMNQFPTIPGVQRENRKSIANGLTTAIHLLFRCDSPISPTKQFGINLGGECVPLHLSPIEFSIFLFLIFSVVFCLFFCFSKEIRNELCEPIWNGKRNVKEENKWNHCDMSPRLRSWLEKDRRHSSLWSAGRARTHIALADGCSFADVHQIVIGQLSLAVLISSLHNDFLTYLFLGVHFNKWANICFTSVTQKLKTKKHFGVRSSLSLSLFLFRFPGASPHSKLILCWIIIISFSLNWIVQFFSSATTKSMDRKNKWNRNCMLMKQCCCNIVARVRVQQVTHVAFYIIILLIINNGPRFVSHHEPRWRLLYAKHLIFACG